MCPTWSFWTTASVSRFTCCNTSFHSGAQPSAQVRRLPSSTIIYHHLPSPIKSSPYNTAQQQLIQGHVPRKRVFYTRCGFLKCIFITFFLKLSLSNKVCPTALSEGIERKKEMSDGSFGFRSTRCVHLQFEIPALISPYTCRSLAARDPHCAC